MTYSKKRLAVIAVAWLFAALIVGVPVEFGVDAQNSNCGTAGDPLDGPPCKFPAEANVGGIVLGTSELTGEDLTAFDGVGTSELPPNRVDSSEDVVGLGLNQVDAEDFFIYKSFKFDSDGDGSNDANTYIWAGAETGSLDGTDDCGDGSADEQVGRETCDLFVDVGEVSFGYIEAEGDTPFILPDVDADAEDYWVIDPEDDSECGIFDALLAGAICLELIVDGSLTGNLADVSVEAEDVLIRGHRVSAIEAADGTNKELDLQNVYIETRWRKGGDRAQNLPFADSVNDPDVTRSAAITNDYRCEGNPTQDDPSCVIDSDRQGWTGVGDESYDDIHR